MVFFYEFFNSTNSNLDQRLANYELELNPVTEFIFYLWSFIRTELTICLCFTFGWFCSTGAELSSCKRYCAVCKVYYIYYLVLYRKCLPTATVHSILSFSLLNGMMSIFINIFFLNMFNLIASYFTISNLSNNFPNYGGCFQFSCFITWLMVFGLKFILFS